MSRSFRWHAALCLAVFLAAVTGARAQVRDPHIGYAYPAGGRQGTTFDITIGGQYLNGVAHAHFSGGGVRAKIIEHKKPLTRKQVNDLNKKMRELRKPQGKTAKKGAPNTQATVAEAFKAFARTMGLEDMDIPTFSELRKKFLDPKRQPNPQIDETVTVRVTVSPDARPGERQLRLRTPTGFTNPLFLHVGQCPEYREKEPNDKEPDAGIQQPLPVAINGQILPGDVDRFRFKAIKGTRLVAAVYARKLMPYLADAVPGWFQATLTLFDAHRNVVAYQDDFRFHPDPVISCEVPEDGEYVLEIKDAIYRGREDFVYRIVLGDVPFVTGIFPLGGPVGAQTTVAVTGWNLPVDELSVDGEKKRPGVLPVSVSRGTWVSNRVPFALDTLPECLEKEPNDAKKARKVKLPVIVNGRIGRPGDCDVFRFTGRAGDEVVAEVLARRLESPLDSILKVTDAAGKQLAVNDDHEDKGAGLATHHADSRLSVTLPADADYLIHLGDTQHKGGTAYGYRLRLGPRRPDFQLRVVPSGINARAGMTVPVTVYALRSDGFSGDIALNLKDTPKGFALSGGWIPDGRDKVRLTLTLPQVPLKEPVELCLQGRATIDGSQVRRTAVPAEDMMQAFLYRHLVPMQDWMVSVTGRKRYGSPLELLEDAPVRLAAGDTARVRFAAPKGQFAKQVQLELSEPPEGIAIEKVSPDQAGLVILLTADAAKVKPGLKGNLIVNTFMEYTPKPKDGKPRPKRRVPTGTLPAIPFEIVAARPATFTSP